LEEGLASENVGIFMAILSIFRPNGIHIILPFGTSCGLLVCCTEKNLATLELSQLIRIPKKGQLLIPQRLYLQTDGILICCSMDFR
jgi:hypothetical protein